MDAASFMRCAPAASCSALCCHRGGGGGWDRTPLTPCPGIDERPEEGRTEAVRSTEANVRRMCAIADRKVHQPAEIIVISRDELLTLRELTVMTERSGRAV